MQQFEPIEFRPTAVSDGSIATVDDVGQRLEAAREADRVYREQRKVHVERLLGQYNGFYVLLVRVLAGVAGILGSALVFALSFNLRQRWGAPPMHGDWEEALRSPTFFLSALILQSVGSMIAGGWIDRRQAALKKKLAEYGTETAT